ARPGVAEVHRDRARCHAACDLTGLVAPHAVGDDEHVELRKQDEPVLIVATLPADVGETCRDRPHSRSVVAIVPARGVARSCALFARRLEPLSMSSSPVSPPLVVDNPYTLAEAVRIPLADASLVDRTLDTAREAARAFGHTRLSERVKLCLSAVEQMEAAT